VPEERLYFAKASIAFGAVLIIMLLGVMLLLGGCANGCKQRAGDGMCVDETHNSAG